MLVGLIRFSNILRRRAIEANDGFVAVFWMRLSDWKFISLVLCAERMGD